VGKHFLPRGQTTFYPRGSFAGKADFDTPHLKLQQKKGVWSFFLGRCLCNRHSDVCVNIAALSYVR